MTDPYPRVSRNETIQIAESLAQHSWYARECHIFHGIDEDGIPVETPDMDLQKVKPGYGWWIPNAYNTGIPYTWGGFSNIDEFERGLEEGKFAGDIVTDPSRKQYRGSQFTVGLDCSGLISRCWKLPLKHSTRSLVDKGVCYELTDVRELVTGDILNRYNAHVFLFCEFVDTDPSKAQVFDVGSKTGKVTRRELPLAPLLRDEFKPFRYRAIKA